jgi:amino acid transporter
LNRAAPADPPAAPRRELSWFDSTSIIVGIIIGAGIYQTAPGVASAVTTPWGMFGLWLLGGLFSLCGALCYAELASAFPREGGDYVYLNRAYGPWAGFLFGWLQLLVVRPGDIAVMAFAFATYWRALVRPEAGDGFLLASAAAAVGVLTVINILGVRTGKWTQNLLTSAKVAGLLGIVAVGLLAPEPAAAPDAAAVAGGGGLPLSVALILVMFTYGGWNEMAYVAAEVRNPERNIVRALVSGTCAVTVLYLLVNGAFLAALGLPGMSRSAAVATDTVKTLFPESAGRLVSALICVSALGAVNGLIFTGARISYAMGAEHRLFKLLGRWTPGTGTPAWALAVQGAISLALIVVLGSFLSAVLYTAAAVYLFYTATGIAVAVLRRREPNLHRPFRVTLYPLPLIVFVGFCLFLAWSAITYKPWMAAGSALILLIGLGVYGLDRRRPETNNS